MMLVTGSVLGEFSGMHLGGVIAWERMSMLFDS